MLLKYRFVLLLLLISFIAGCNPSRTLVEKTIVSLKNNSLEKDWDSKFNVSTSSTDYLLYNEEAGRLALIHGEHSKSLQYFNNVLFTYNQNEMKATINVSDTSRTILASTIGSDSNLVYYGSDFERVLANFYQAINYLKQNKLEKSIVEVRAAHDIQKYAQAKREKRIAGQEEKLRKYNFSKEIKDQLNGANNIVSNEKNKFLNAYVYYISGNIRELTGDFNSALVDYKNALELYPNNKSILEDALRLSKVYDGEYYDSLQKKYHNATYNDVESYDSSKTVLLIYDQGFIPKKSVFNFGMYLSNSFVKLSVPIYDTPAEPLKNVSGSVWANNKLVSLGTFNELSNNYVFAKNDLQEKYVGIITRQIARLTSKTVVQESLGRSSSNDTQLLGGILGVASLLTEWADTRSMISLPMYTQVLKLNTKTNINQVKVSINNMEHVVNLNFKNNDIAIIYIVDTGGYVYSDVIFQGNKVNFN